MAKDDAQDAVEVLQPDLERMRRIFSGDLRPLNEEGAKVRGEQAAAWKMIEADCHCNKRAAKVLFKLYYESEDTRDDFLRTFLDGLVALDIMPKRDLVDLANDESAAAPKGTKAMGAEMMPTMQ